MINPLTLLMPLKPGTSPESIIGTLKANQDQVNSALKEIGTVHFARFLLLDRSQPNLLPDLKKTLTSDTLVLGVITEYDGDFKPYIQAFAKNLGDAFDSMLKYAIGGDALIPVRENVPEFLAYLSTVDASQHDPNQNLDAAYPQTVQEILAKFSSP
ncbi:hypothetical protein ACFQNF_07475 [Iodobacter arcticus]|uniref:Uncharacterized protein n=1 Tax=Iodobacter arcticus TaxID=590593 RepID=A0ABW2QW38_9NEIS